MVGQHFFKNCLQQKKIFFKKNQELAKDESAVTFLTDLFDSWCSDRITLNFFIALKSCVCTVRGEIFKISATSLYFILSSLMSLKIIHACCGKEAMAWSR